MGTKSNFRNSQERERLVKQMCLNTAKTTTYQGSPLAALDGNVKNNKDMKQTNNETRTFSEAQVMSVQVNQSTNYSVNYHRCSQHGRSRSSAFKEESVRPGAASVVLLK